jgi:uncharacterized membrane protein HdeD (DUF308 family)
MRTRAVIAVVLVVVGVVWIGQGLGAIGGSFMTDELIWAVFGAIALIFGISLLIGVRREQKDRPK